MTFHVLGDVEVSRAWCTSSDVVEAIFVALDLARSSGWLDGGLLALGLTVSDGLLQVSTHVPHRKGRLDGWVCLELTSHASEELIVLLTVGR